MQIDAKHMLYTRQVLNFKASTSKDLKYKWANKILV